MRFQDQKRTSGSIVTIILALALPILWATPAVAQEKAEAAAAMAPVKLVDYDDAVEVVGPGWKLHYHSYIRTTSRDAARARLAVAENGRAWFSHGGWLRLIDTRKGVVLGRWHFSDVITKLEPKGEAVLVQYKIQKDAKQSTFRETVIRPDSGKIDFVNPNNLLYARLPMTEAERFGFGFFAPSPDPLVEQQRAKKLLQDFEEMARRDPTSAFIQLAHGRFLKELGDPRAAKVLQAATQVESSDFTELLTISSVLDSLGEADLARAAFERGYKDYLERGNDPRMFHVLIGRLVLYRMPRALPQSDLVSRKEKIERLYRLSPNIEGAYILWRALGLELVKRDDPSAEVWSQRAAQSKENDPILWYSQTIDSWILVYLGSFGAVLIFLLVQTFRYAPQRKLEAAKEAQSKSGGRKFLRGLAYWTRRERIVLATMVLVGWYAFGCLVIVGTGFLRVASVPVSMEMGSLAPPQAREFLKSMPETRGRNFMLALSHHQAGDLDAALRLYAADENSAQAWNNRGVIHRTKGDETKAKQAFEKALQLDKGLAEAKLNLGQPTADLWTSQYREYFPGKPMLAPPTSEQVRETFLGASGSKMYFRALAGPLLGRSREMTFTIPLPVFLVWPAITAFALYLFFFVPYRDVTQPPSRWLHWLEAVFPGTSPAWGWTGGVVLVCCSAFLAAMLIWAETGSVLLLSSFMLVATGHQLNVSAHELMLELLGYGIYLWILPAGLFLINLYFFIRDRKAGVR